jgi:hypothetical protein
MTLVVDRDRLHMSRRTLYRVWRDHRRELGRVLPDPELWRTRVEAVLGTLAAPVHEGRCLATWPEELLSPDRLLAAKLLARAHGPLTPFLQALAWTCTLVPEHLASRVAVVTPLAGSLAALVDRCGPDAAFDLLAAARRWRETCPTPIAWIGRPRTCDNASPRNRVWLAASPPSKPGASNPADRCLRPASSASGFASTGWPRTSCSVEPRPPSTSPSPRP